MKKTCVIVTLLAIFIGAPTAFAKKKSKGGPDAAELIKKYDTNGDGKLDAQELSALLAAELGKKKKKDK